MAKCICCNSEFIPYTSKHVKCSAECRRIVHRATNQRYKNRNREMIRLQGRRESDRLREIWGCEKYIANGHIARTVRDGFEIEARVLPKLESYGFNNFFGRSNGLTKQFAGDLLAERDGKKCLIEITCARMHKVSRHKMFCKWIGLELYVIFVKRDLTRIIIKKIGLDDPRTTVGLSVAEIRAIANDASLQMLTPVARRDPLTGRFIKP